MQLTPGSEAFEVLAAKKQHLKKYLHNNLYMCIIISMQSNQ